MVSVMTPVTVVRVAVMPPRTATIPTPVTRVVAVNKLATLLVEVAETSVTSAIAVAIAMAIAMAMTTTLAQRPGRNTQPQQQHQGRRANQFSCSQKFHKEPSYQLP